MPKAPDLLSLLCYITSKTKERLALIEKGMDPNLAKSDLWIQVGIIAGGAAFGLMAGDVIPGKFGPLVAIFFAGAGLVFCIISSERTEQDINENLADNGETLIPFLCHSLT